MNLEYAVILAAIYLTILAGVAAMWGWFNVSRTYRSNLQHVLRQWDAEVCETASATRQSPIAPGGSASARTSQIEVQRWPSVAILSPGRNEAEHLGETLPELCTQDYPSHRVVFIDDHSDDQTPTITAACSAKYDNLLVVRNDQNPPADWVGKCWAMHMGYRALKQAEAAGQLPTAEWVCFTDADIHWNPTCLRAAMAMAMETEADIVALCPQLTFGTPVEAIVQSQMVLALGLFFPFEKAMDPAHPDTLTGGAFILVRRSLYDSIGGHEAVHDQVVDDINLGRKLKAAGGKVRIALAPQLMWCRMYNGWQDMWEGLTKNAYAGLEYKLWRVAVLSPAVLLCNILPPVYVLISAIWLAVSPGAMSLMAMGLALLTLLLPIRLMNAVRKILELPWPYALAMPAGSAIYLVFVLASTWRYYRGGNIWKGRAYGRGKMVNDQ